MNPIKFGVGHPVRRKEDDALVRGAGHYVADHSPAGLAHGAVLRSPHAHARFKITNADAARQKPGVRLILTGDDIGEYGMMPCNGRPADVKMDVPPFPILARDVVRHVGDAVAFIVADTLDQARDAAEAIEISWEQLPATIGAAEAVKDGAPKVWPAGNIAFEMGVGDKEPTQAAFKTAARVVSLTLVNQRLVTNYLDTRGAIAEYDAAEDRYTLTISSQGSHAVRDAVCRQILNIPREKMRVVTPDVGGGFGTKLFPYREYALVAIASKSIGRPVKWIAERSEHFLGDSQGRDNVTTARLALDQKGKFLAIDVDLIADMGSYLSCYGPYIPAGGAGLTPGVYDIPTCYVRVRGVYTNTVPVDAYRGAGRPEAAYVIERLVDAAAREIGTTPDALRRKNFIKPKAMPYESSTGKLYDSGEFAGHMARAQEIADWDGFKKRAAAAKRKGRIRGIGLSTYVEACGTMGPEKATVQLGKDGTITVLIGTQSSGQGHITAYAQLVADQLGLPPERVNVLQGDTDRVATGLGTGGSASLPSGGNSLAGAVKKLADNLKELAADALETSPADLEIADGAVRVAGTDRAISFPDLANRPDATEERLTTDDAFVMESLTYPNGTHLVEVEIDPATGATDIVNYVVVDDFGATINPLLLEGQVHGGAVQGIGQALMEDTVYDRESGQLMSASLMDYALPRASGMPSFTFETRNVPCKNNPLGVKGAGEAGAVGSCPAVINAIVDALWRSYGIRHIDMPATPARIWAAIAEEQRTHRM
jgi:aerobic carbon-monoxide dehydrogenase large subunit